MNILYNKFQEKEIGEDQIIVSDMVTYKTKIHKIRGRTVLTIPIDIVKKFKLKLGHSVLVKIKRNNDSKKFMSNLSHGAHTFLINIPSHLDIDFKNKKEVEIELTINQFKILEIIAGGDTLDLSKVNSEINTFIEKDKLYIKHKNKQTKRGHVINRFFKIDKYAAYIIGLYDAEGAKQSFRFTNSDPSLIRIFLNFIEKSLGLKQEEFDAQITLNRNKDKEETRKFWSELFPNLYIYNKISTEKGVKGSEYGTLHVLINTITLNSIWKNIRKEVHNRLYNDRNLCAAYLSGILDGDGECHHKKDSISCVRITLVREKEVKNVIKVLENLDINYKIKEDKKHIQIGIYSFDNLIKLFNINALFRYNKARRNKFLELLPKHRKAKVLLRTLKAVESNSQNIISIANHMGIDAKHRYRIKNYLEDLSLYNMIKIDNNRVYLLEAGRNFLSLI